MNRQIAQVLFHTLQVLCERVRESSGSWTYSVLKVAVFPDGSGIGHTGDGPHWS